jgi:hypothetical protein
MGVICGTHGRNEKKKTLTKFSSENLNLEGSRPEVPKLYGTSSREGGGASSLREGTISNIFCRRLNL